VSEGGWLVSLDQEVACPGKAIADNRPCQRIDWMPENECRNDNRQSQKGAYGVQKAIATVTVFFKIKGKEFFIAVEGLWFWQNGPPQQELTM